MLSSVCCVLIGLERRSAFALAPHPFGVDSGKPALLLHRVYYGARRSLSGLFAHTYSYVHLDVDMDAHMDYNGDIHLNFVAHLHPADSYCLAQQHAHLIHDANRKPYPNPYLDGQPHLYLHPNTFNYAFPHPIFDCLPVYDTFALRYAFHDTLPFTECNPHTIANQHLRRMSSPQAYTKD